MRGNDAYLKTTHNESMSGHCVCADEGYPISCDAAESLCSACGWSTDENRISKHNHI